MTLGKYQQKRNFKKTPEPKGKKSEGGGLTYVIQKHAASHLHYDFRLAWNGVLKSWALPKGPSYSTKEKHLAVQVEDHPLDYANFEGNIPKEQYGGGTVMLWDKGTWEPLDDDPEQGLIEGKLVFRLNGEKLKGKWALVRMNIRSHQPSWLLIKKTDEYANAISDRELLNTVSVKSGLTMDEIAAEKGKKVEST